MKPSNLFVSCRRPSLSFVHHLILIYGFIALIALSSSSSVSVLSGSRILFLTPVTSPSHSTFFRPVVQALVHRGHFVTYWNGLKPATASSATSAHNSNNNTRQQLLRHLYSDQVGQLNDDHNVQFQDRDHPFRLLFTFYGRTVAACNALYDDVIFHRLMTSSDEHFDLIVIDGVLNECVLPLVHRFQSPLIYMNGFQASPWLLDAVGAPLSSSTYPNPAFSFASAMTIGQRALNALSNVFIVHYRNWFIMSTVDGLFKRHLEQEAKTNNGSSPYTSIIPNVREIEQRHLSLVITNTHFSLNYQHPKVDALVETGALHCQPSKQLPKVYEQLNNSLVSNHAPFINLSALFSVGIG